MVAIQFKVLGLLHLLKSAQTPRDFSLRLHLSVRETSNT